MTTESQDFIPVGGSFFKIPSSSNLRWLIMFYALPRELVEKRPAFLSMPRKVREVIHNDADGQFRHVPRIGLGLLCVGQLAVFQGACTARRLYACSRFFLSVLRQLSALAVCLHNGRTYQRETRQNAGILLSATVFYGERLRSAVDAL